MTSAPFLIQHIHHLAEAFYLLGDKALCAVYFEGGKIRKPNLDLICSEIFLFFSCELFSVIFIKQHVSSDISDWK